MSEENKKVAVLFISGQSNAHAHKQVLDECDRIKEPLKNVFSLDRNPNQSFDIEDVTWSGFTGEGKNLGETQDHTASFAYHFAKRWQSAIDSGEYLPDLYIVQISIGSQGILNGMWNPDKEKIMKPGDLDHVNISLYPWALQVNKLAMENLKKAGKRPKVIGWHWIGSEQDILTGGYDRADFIKRYDDFFDAMLQSIGEPCPLYLYKIHMERFCERKNYSKEGIPVVNEALQRQCQRYEKAAIVDAEQSPYWDDTAPNFGIFAEDKGHYLAKVQKWYADRFYEEIKKTFDLRRSICLSRPNLSGWKEKNVK